MTHDDIEMVFARALQWTARDVAYVIRSWLSKGSILCVCRYGSDSAPEYEMDLRICDPISSVSVADAIARMHDWAWVVVAPDVPRQPGRDADGVSIVSLDGCRARVVRVIRYPATRVTITPMWHTIQVMHRRRPVEIVGMGMRYMDVEWQSLCTPEMLAEQGRIDVPTLTGGGL